MRTRLFTAIVCLLAGGFAAAPAEAQYGARRTTANRATGETYRVEVAGTIWNPTPDIVISSESLGILGDQVDFVNTLGIEKTKFKQIKLVLRPTRQSTTRPRRRSPRRLSSTASASIWACPSRRI